MSEVNERNMEAEKPETADDTLENRKTDDNENHAAEPKQMEKKPKKKRKAAKIGLPAAALLLVIALLFGAVVGYGYGRGVYVERLQDAQARADALLVALEEAAAAPVYDAFDEEMTSGNQAALNDLSGSEPVDDTLAEELGESEILSQMLEGEAAEAVVVAEYEGGVIMSDEAAREYEEQMAALKFAGYNESDVSETLIAEVLRYLVSDRLLEARAKEMGLYELTDADRADIAHEAQHIYDDELEFYRDFVNTQGMSEEEATGAVKAYLLENEGVSLDSLKAELEDGWWMQKLYDAVTADVVADEELLQAAYDDLMALQKENFDAYADDYEFAQMNGETIVYNRPGYRAVRMLAFGFEDPQAYEAVSILSEEITELDAEKDAEMIEKYRAEIESWYAPVEEEARAVREQIETGEDMIRMGADPDVVYHVAADSPLWSREITEAVMALEKPGDISGVVRTMDGACILEYVQDVPAGPVPLAEVAGKLESQALDAAKYAAYEAQVDAWLEQANAVYYPERMQ